MDVFCKGRERSGHDIVNRAPAFQRFFQNKPAPCAMEACGSPVNFRRTAVNFGSYECLEIMGQDLGKTSRLLSKWPVCSVVKLCCSFMGITDLLCSSSCRHSTKRWKKRLGADESRSSDFFRQV